jgi:hypothetical protein
VDVRNRPERTRSLMIRSPSLVPDQKERGRPRCDRRAAATRKTKCMSAADSLGSISSTPQPQTRSLVLPPQSLGRIRMVLAYPAGVFARLALHQFHSSSASRVTAGAAGFPAIRAARLIRSTWRGRTRR